MAEPEHSTMHNFAYHPSVASWVQSTALAQLDGASDEVSEQSPDDFYKSAFTQPAGFEPSPHQDDMTTTRQRQQASNGAPRSKPKPSIRSVSGPAPSSTASATPSTPQLPGNRPTVRSLAQKFNQPSSTESSPATPRTRPVRPSPHARSTLDSPASQASASSPARPAKEASYGAYKFNNLKPRERPQPAPPSPASVRRANGGRTSLDKQTTPVRRKLSSPTRGTARQPFFGEVIGEHNESTPGYGIPTLEPTFQEPDLTLPAVASTSTIKLVTEEAHSPTEVSHQQPVQAQHQRSASEMTAESATPHQTAENRTPRRRSPPSRIPVATRRMSAASDSSSSTRSLKYGGTRPVGGYSRASPTRPRAAAASRGGTSPKKSKVAVQPTLPAVSYRGYRERGKSPQGANSGPRVAAVITAPLGPTSPRLRNSRERQTLQESPGSRSRSADPHGTAQDYFGNGTTSDTQEQQAQMGHLDRVDETPSTGNVDLSAQHSTGLGVEDHGGSPVSNKQELDSPPPPRQQGLSLDTGGSRLQPSPQPTSSTTHFEYEESPVLGMPGSFMATPPIVQHTTPRMDTSHHDQQNGFSGELLQARTFCPPTKERIPEAPVEEDLQGAPSEFGLRESIPIMLGSDGPHAGWEAAPTRSRHSPRLSIGAHRFRADPLDTTGSISYLDEDDSPVDPFAHRESLRPDDSASVAFYHQAREQSSSWMPQVPNVVEAGSFTLDSEAYSVINKVLNIYHQSDAITPEIAHDSRQQVQSVSPIIAQHKDWGSKEATETYLARLLSDAAGSEKSRDDEGCATAQHPTLPANPSVPSLSIPDMDKDPEEPVVGGTAIIFPSESRRYSRGSRGSSGSTTTTIWEGPSRPESSSGLHPRDHHQGNAPSTLAPHPPPKDWTHQPAHSDHNIRLPEIAGAGEGLGLSLQNGHQKPQQPTTKTAQQPPPPRPAYSPPPPPKTHVRSGEIDTGDQDNMGQILSKIWRQRSPSPRESILEPLLELTPDSTSEEIQKSVRESMREPMREPLREPPQEPPTEPPEEPTQEPPQDVVEPQAGRPPAKLLKRYRAIEELTRTEHSFCIDMMVAHSIFESTASEILDEKERRLLFSNCRDLEKFSHGIWQALKDCVKPIVNSHPPENGEPYNEYIYLTAENDQHVNIGAVMLQFLPKMERLYTTYYLNYQDAADFIKKKGNDPEILGWVMACFQHCQSLTTAWDLDSLLVKPCQRMLKYPIMLEQLVEATDPDHPDLKDLKNAQEAIKQIGDRINMAKRRQETLRAATSEGKKQKNKGRFGKSIVKALISNKDRGKMLQEAATVFEDPEYDAVAQKFGGYFFHIQILLHDLDNYLDCLTDQMLELNKVNLAFITMAEVGPPANTEMESTWRRWAMGYLELQSKALEEHKADVRERVMKPVGECWEKWTGPQKLIEERKKQLIQYAKYKQAIDRKERVDSNLKKQADAFLTVNDALKQELPRLYQCTKTCVRLCIKLFLCMQKDWYKTCSKKILPLLDTEPQHTTSISYDLKTYVDRFKSDWRQMEDRANNLAIVNHDLLNGVATFTSPVPTFYSDDGSSRKSSSRRTESIGSDMSIINNRNRNSGGYGSSSRSGMTSFEGPPRSSPATAYAGPSGLRERVGGAISPRSESSEATVTQGRRPAWTNLSRNVNNFTLDGAHDDPYVVPPSIGPSFLNPPPSTSNPGSSRTSGVFNSALPMADSPSRSTADIDPPVTPGDMEEPEVLFLAASLFEFNIAHDRREGGIPYLVYVPGEIFDVIGMKGELWLARNQDDPSRSVGWIWEKHFARILPEEV